MFFILTPIDVIIYPLDSPQRHEKQVKCEQEKSHNFLDFVENNVLNNCLVFNLVIGIPIWHGKISGKVKMNMVEFNFRISGWRVLLLALLSLLLWAFAADGAFAMRYYVKPTGSDAELGTSWMAAFQTLTKAVSVAVTGDDVWVAQGTYAESATVSIPSGVSLFGGFAGTETALSQRKVMTNATIIDGQNARQCVTNAGVLDGFRVTNGKATSGYGGGINNTGTVTNCIVYNNTCSGHAGGIYNTGTVTNCIVYGNTASGWGGGIFNVGFVTNCTVTGNNASYYDGIFNNVGIITNCIVWRNKQSDIVGIGKVTYSCLGEGWTGEGNLRGNPLFVNTSGDASTWDFRLQDGSPCVDAGTLNGAPTTDIAGAERPGSDGKVCMGAYESPAEYEPLPPRPVTRLYVKTDGGDDTAEGTSWTASLQTISQAMSKISNDDIREIWVAKGTYYGTVKNPARSAIYGGFAGTESDISQRDWETYPTIIDGQSWQQCVSNAGILDGFFVTKGRSLNYAGVLNSGAVTNCIVYNNTSSNGDGGGIGNAGSVTNCKIYNNSAYWGGGVDNIQNGSIINCAIYGNNAYEYGGGIYNVASVTNCTVYGNTADLGGGIYNSNFLGNGIVTNCIVWGNYYDDICDLSGITTYSCFKEGTLGTGNISADPLFVNTSGYSSTWVLSLKSNSPCIDKGTAVGAPAFDILGVTRPQGAGVDMGAYERLPLPGQNELINAILGRENIPNGDVNVDGKLDVADLVTLIISQP